MKVFILLAIAAPQINGQVAYSQEGGSGHGDMDMSGSGMGYGMGSGMDGSGMEGAGFGLGASGYGVGSGMGGSGFGGDWMDWGAGVCCPTKKISGSIDPEKDGIYDLVIDGYMVIQS